MDSEEVASTLNMMPEHLKDGAKTKFKQLTGFAQSSAEEIKKISSQAADKVNPLLKLHCHMTSSFCSIRFILDCQSNPNPIQKYNPNQITIQLLDK
jgi:hypothetical protein